MLAALLVLLAQAASSKAPPELVVNLQWALGRPVPADWQPLQLDLQSAVARDLDLEIVVQDEVTSARLARRESLPARGRRRLFLYLPAGRHEHAAGVLHPQLSVREAGGRELATFSLAGGRAPSADDLLLGLLTSPAAGDLGLGQGWRTSAAAVELIRLTPELIPDRWTGLAPLRALLLHDAALDALGPEQARALRDYVRQGGTLLLPPTASRDGLSHPVLAALAEIRLGPVETRTGPPALAKRFGAPPSSAPFRVHPVLNGKPLPGLEDLGLASFPAGFGRVVVLPFEIHAAPFHGWNGTTSLLGQLAADAPRGNAAWTQGEGLPGNLGGPDGRTRLLGRMQSLVNPYPSFLLLAALTGLYLGLVGPLNYLALRRLRMTLLLVVTVPAISLGFLAVTLGVAYLVKGRSTTLTSVRMLATADGLPCAREFGVTALFSPSTRAYEVVPPPGRAPLPLLRSDPRQRGLPDAPPLEMEEVGGDSRVRSVTVGQWQSWALETRALVELGRGIRWRAREGALRVDNGSPLAIERALFVSQGDLVSATPVGAVESGGSAEVRLDPSRWSPLEDLGFGELSLGAKAVGDCFAELRTAGRYRSSQDALRPADLLLCVVREAGPGVEVDARRSGDSRSLTLLVVREAPR
jgi:hypothetical protein